VTEPSFAFEVKALLADALAIPSLTGIPDDAQLDVFSRWDSLAHIQVMMALEQRFTIELTPELILELTSLPKIVAYLQSLQAR
jgi:citrate synthase